MDNNYYYNQQSGQSQQGNQNPSGGQNPQTNTPGTAPDAGKKNVTFTVTNQAGETDVKTKTITVKNSTLPILELTSHTATLEVGATFNFYSYIKTARDIDGSSLNDNISISGTVDTSRRGTYQVVYSTISRVSLEKVEKTLTVRVG